MDDSAIKFHNVTKKFHLQENRTFKEFLPSLLMGNSWAKELTVFSDISFEINVGETVGIVGKNGSGKSTILKLIAGVTSPTKGQVEIHGKVAPLIEVGAGFHQELTGLENIFLNAAILGMHKKEIEQKADSIIKFSELEGFMNVPVKRYSSGMYMRLGFAIAIHANASILLIDEVLAVGDAAFQQKCLDYLKELKKDLNKTIVFVSHDEKAVRNFCNRVILLDHGSIIEDSEPEKAFAKYHSIINSTNKL